VNVAKPLGESIVLELGDRTRIHGELVAVSESTVVLSAPDGLKTLPCSGVRRLTVLGYDLKAKRLAVWAPFATVCVGTLGWVVGRVLSGSDAWLFGVSPYVLVPASVAVGALASFTILRGDPRTSFAFPPVPADLELVRLYARYPEGLTPERLELLRHP
jgi:hypothetical protein